MFASAYMGDRDGAQPFSTLLLRGQTSLTLRDNISDALLALVAQNFLPPALRNRVNRPRQGRHLVKRGPEKNPL